MDINRTMYRIANFEVASPGRPDDDYSRYLVGPDMLLDFCRVRMGHIDDSLKTAMAQQTTKQHQQEAVLTLLNAMQKFSPKGPQSEADWQEVKAAYKELESKLGPDDPVCKQCAATMQSIEAHTHKGDPPNVAAATKRVDDAMAKMANPNFDGVKQATKDEYNAAVDAQTYAKQHPDPLPFTALGDKEWDSQGPQQIDGLLSNLKAGNELDMIQLQSLVSQRQVVIQLVTGMMTKIDETNATAARAIGS